MPLTTQDKIDIRKNGIKRMELELEDLKVRHTVQENLDRKDAMERLEKDMADLVKSIKLVEDQIDAIENPPKEDKPSPKRK